MIVGHTAQPDGRIHDRCGGSFVLADSLISQYYTGTAHPSALESMQTARFQPYIRTAASVSLCAHPEC